MVEGARFFAEFWYRESFFNKPLEEQNSGRVGIEA
jgi:hypothetical protein